MELRAVAEDLGDVEALERLDLRGFLQRTGDLPIEPSERLRRLAIELEWIGMREGEQPRAWLALDRIYAAAHRLDPNAWLVLHSRGISATECATLGDPPAAARRRILDAGARAFHDARALVPDEHDVAYSMGQLLYRDPDASCEDALRWFRRALEGNETPDRAWAQLYVAHCLHDLERYEEAMVAYARVDAHAFDGPRQWRYALLLEQHAECRLLAGDIAGAEAEFLRLVERYESLPVLEDALLSRHMVEPMRGPLRDRLGDRVAALARQHGNTWAIERLRTPLENEPA